MMEQPRQIEARRPLFALGQVVATPGALQALEDAQQTPTPYLARHVRGDWGNIGLGDRGLNEQALVDGSRIFSVYTLPTAETIWIITEADRAYTTLLLPADY